MTAKPRVVLAHFPGVQFLSDHDIARIDEVATLLDREPLGSWQDPRADALLGQAQVLLGHWGCPLVDAAVLDRAPDLGLFAYMAGTVKGTLTDAVFARGVRVTSGANANAEPVAEFTLAAILFANKQVTRRRDQLRGPSTGAAPGAGGVAPGNWGKTIGIIGASFVGRRLIELLRSFPHLSVALYDPFVSPDEAAALGVTKLGLDELCAASDVLSIHAPELPSTRHMLGARQLGALRTGATVINTARGSLLDHEALAREVASGRLYAMLDVTDPEPLPRDHPLRTDPNVFLTPHLAGSEGPELARLTEHAADEIRRWAAGEPAANEVTRSQLDRLA